ncbi:MAG TPA: hypothetical protein VHO67_02410 [Polyangia bacterium]|nr:hypothetical protein [Polyangia bacterium]
MTWSPSAVNALLAALAVGLGGACATPHAIVDDPFDVAETSTAPDVTAIVDIGGGDVPLHGELAMEPSDGVSVIGEALWVRGRSFGRQPTVEVGGRPAAVLGRTHDGGLVVRVPPGTPSGSQPVAVSNEIGRGERPISVRRYAAVLAPGAGQIGWADVGAQGAISAGNTAVAGARWLALSSDGRAAYVAAAQGAPAAIDVVDLPAPGTPKTIYRLDLGRGGPVTGLAAAARAPVLAVVRGADVMLVDTSSPLHPARSAPRPLPRELRDAPLVAVDLSPNGKLLALATEAGNQIFLLDLGTPGRAPVAGALAVVPEVRESVLCDIAFSPGGDTLWVLSGDTPRSAVVGPQPTELRAVRIGADANSLAHLTVDRTVAVPEAARPVRLGVGRALPLASGAAIRLPPERHVVYFAAAQKAGGATSVFAVGNEDTAAAALTAPDRFGRPDITYDGRWLLAPALAADGAVRVLAAAADGRPAPAGAARPVSAVPAAGGEVPVGSRPVPELRIQP